MLGDMVDLLFKKGHMRCLVEVSTHLHFTVFVRIQDDSMTALVPGNTIDSRDVRARKSGSVLYNCAVSSCGQAERI